MGRTGIFGGSFDPVHSGHVRIALEALDELSLDRLYVVPAATSPFKVDSVKGGFDRLLLVRAAFNGVGRAVVDDREIRRGGVSYAIDTVREIAAENPGSEIFFIIGEDSLEGLARWKDWDELKELCRFKAYPRSAESSTEIRRRLASGEPVDDLVPRDVALLLKHAVVYDGENPQLTRSVLRGLSAKGGYCPCRLAKTPENFCICEEFRGRLADENFHGPCHCRLYRKP